MIVCHNLYNSKIRVEAMEVNLETIEIELGDRSKTTKIFEQLYQQCHLTKHICLSQYAKKKEEKKKGKEYAMRCRKGNKRNW